MTPLELKNSILQLAIQGKLVEQRAEEGTAEELYKQIQEEKKKLIAEKKIKKEKTLAPITEDEIPFDIPESWKWVRFGDCTTYSQKKEKIQSSLIDGEMWSLDLEDIEKNSGRIVKRCLAKDRIISGDKVIFHEGQVLYSKLRPYLKKVLVAPDSGIATSEIVPFYGYANIDSVYLKYYLISPHVDFIINSVTYGVKMPRVGTDTMIGLLLPLPPLAEQKRIVQKIEELLPLVDQYGEAWARLEEFNKRFPEDMQKSVLQMAIQGKLVEQRAEEGTAEELYKQIQEEKKKLIAEKKIKKEKPLAPITDDEIPFDIPDNWMWCRVGELFRHSAGKALNASNKEGQKLSYITTSNLYWNRFELSNLREMYYKDSELEKCTAHKGDLLVCEGGDIGRAAIWNYSYDIRIQNHIHKLTPYNGIDVKFYYYCFYLYKNLGLIGGKGIAIQGLSANALKLLVFPLPPLKEQKRIVERIEQILPLCERLK